MGQMHLFEQAEIDFLEKLINTPSPTGYEEMGQKVWLDYIKPYIDEYEVDNYGSVYGIINPGQPYKVVIEAHCDEISWFVNYITDDGFIHVIRNGGSDQVCAPSKRVHIHTKKHGVVDGVFGWPAIHTRKGESREENPSLKNIFIDVGAFSKEEVLSLGIEVGNVITYQDKFQILNNRFFMGRALDNRAGGFMIAQVAKMLKENKIELPYTLYVVNAVQEEVGLRGAQMATQNIQPNVAIVTDVCHDTTTPLIDKRVEGNKRAGKGPSVTIAPAVHNKLLHLIEDIAEENNIPVQRLARSRVTGTDADSFAYSNGGVPTGLITLPLRYMHTTVESVHIRDVKQVIELIYGTLLKLTPEFDFKYFK